MGVFRISADSSGDFLLTNSEFLRIFHLDSFDALLGTRMRDLFLNRDEWEDFYIELHAKKQVSGLEVQLNEIGGSSYWASINARLIGQEDSETGWWIDGTLEDISSRKLGEERNISQMENLRQASLTLTASLDLREVLGTIAECALDLVPGMRNCHIFLYQSENGDKLIFGTALWGMEKEMSHSQIPAQMG